MKRQYGYATTSSSNTATTTSFTITKTKGIKVELAKILEEYVKLNKKYCVYGGFQKHIVNIPGMV
jgi:hypothetical protein